MANGKRGPAPTPTAVLAKRGSWRAKTNERKNEVQITAPLDVPPPPSWVGEKARVYWDDIAPRIHEHGLLTHADLDTLALLCDAIADYIEIRDGEAKVKADARFKRDPTDIAKREARTEILKLLDKFGMSPSARSGLQIAEKPKKPTPELKLFAKD